LKDLGGKLDASDKKKIETEINNVKDALKGTDNEKIKSAADKLQQVFYELSSKIYQQNPNMDQSAQAGHDTGGNQDNVYDADYEVVDDDDKK